MVRHLAATIAFLLLPPVGCSRDKGPPDAARLDEVRSGFNIYWPPMDPEDGVPATASRLWVVASVRS